MSNRERNAEIRRLYADGMFMSAIGRRFNLSQARVSVIIHNPDAPEREEAWTPELIEELRDLWARGLTGSKIGDALGMTKDAVIGKAHRLKLPSRPSPIRKGSKPKPPRIKPALKLKTFAIAKPKQPPKAVKGPPPKQKQPQPYEQGRSSDSIKRRYAGCGPAPKRCQFIAEHPTADDSCKCLAPVRDGSAYCAVHHARCYMAGTSQVDRKRVRAA